MSTEIKLTQGQPYKIVCVQSYEFEGTEFKVDDISYNSWGRNIPDRWRKATQEDVNAYLGFEQPQPNL